MRRIFIAALLLLLPAAGWAQNGSFIRYHPPGGGGVGSGDCDPAQWSSPAGLVVFGGVSGACTADIEDATLPFFAQGAGTVPGTGRQGDFYIENDLKRLSFYANTDDPITTISFSETSTAGMGFVIDEDSFATDSATKVPTQQSVKAYVDAQAGGSSATYVDEFASALNTTGNIGELGWTLAQVGGAGTYAANDPSTVGHPGIGRATSGVSDNGGPQLANTIFAAGYLTAGDWEISLILTPEDAVTNTYLSFGLVGGTTLAETGAVRIWYDTDVSHATWIFQICDSATTGCQSAGDDTNSNTVASTKTPTAGTYQRLRIRRAQSGVGGNPTFYFSVGDAAAMETEKTFCSATCDETLANLPGTATGVKLAVIARAAATSKDLLLDRFELIDSGARY